MKTTLTTATTAARDRSRHWHDAIASTYFPLDLKFRHPGPSRIDPAEKHRGSPGWRRNGGR